MPGRTGLWKGVVVADSKTEMAEDLELSESKAGEIKGGRTPIERDAGVPRGLATHKHKKGAPSTPKPLHGSMTHE